jgi:glyoxylase-like metal-dependent hydrolase (beta-lactamase superfamily II)
MNRRDFLRWSGTCAAHLGLLGGRSLSIGAQSPSRATYRVEVEQPWGRLERIADGVWALVSTPLSGGENAMRTFSNGGIVAGKSGVLIVEGFGSGDGARWMGEQARTLTGHPPTHVVLTHFHGDHSAGLLGYRDQTATLIYVTTAETRERLAGRGQSVIDTLASAQLVAPGAATSLDLGGRRVTITPRAGHTPSDLTVLVDDPAVLFGGDLLWNRHFPNYVDAIPSLLSREVRAMSDARGVVRVPGHGAIFAGDDLAHYIGVIDAVENAARKARSEGTPSAEAAKTFMLPASLGEWTKFSGNYVEVALRAWERELAG